TFPLPARGHLDLGRPTSDRPVDVDLNPDHQVSRLHARLSCDEAGVWIEDLGSLSGTWVEGFDIRSDILERPPLKPGEPLLVGLSTLTWSLCSDGPSSLESEGVASGFPGQPTRDPKAIPDNAENPAMELTFSQVNELVDALVQAFNFEEFKEILSRRLGISL